jgi:opine dehydrogenase
MRIAILGAGAGGTSAAVELAQDGHAVRLWNRSSSSIAGFASAGGIHHAGVLGDGFTPIDIVTTQLKLATDGADVLLVCLPTLAHASLARSLIEARIVKIPTILNPGHTGGALEFSHAFFRQGLAPPPIVEFSTLTYVARVRSATEVLITGCAKSVRVAAMPGGALALAAARSLYACARPVANVLETSLSNINMVLHPPGATLAAAWMEATGGNFTFYVEGLTEGVARVMEGLDVERRAVARGFDIHLPSLFEEMQTVGTIEYDVDSKLGLAAAIRGGVANRTIRAPGSFSHRYYQEDLWYGLKPFLALAEIAGAQTPCARSLMQLGQLAAGPYAPAGERTAVEMGIAGMNRDALLDFVTERSDLRPQRNAPTHRCGSD